MLTCVLLKNTGGSFSVNLIIGSVNTHTYTLNHVTSHNFTVTITLLTGTTMYCMICPWAMENF